MSSADVGMAVNHTHTLSSVSQSQQKAFLVSELQHLSHVFDVEFIAKLNSHAKQLIGESKQVLHGDLQGAHTFSEVVKKPSGHPAKQD